MPKCPFLSVPNPGPLGYVASTYQHARGMAEVHYYPPRNNKTPKDIIVFLPGNPGLISYYTPFLLKLQSHLSPHYAFLAHSHIGHSPSQPHPSIPLKLYEQVDSKVEFILSLTEELVEIRRREGGDVDRPVRIGFIGHSVGSEIAIQTMRQLDDYLESNSTRPAEVEPLASFNPQFEMKASFLLFPTISHIAQTPNGQKLRPIFVAPLIQLLPALCYLIHPLIRVLQFALSFIPIPTTSASGPTTTITASTTTNSRSSTSIYTPNATTLNFLSSPATVKHVLHLAKSEMISITRPDLDWYEENKSRLWSYWGDEDGWVGKQGDEVKRVLRGTGRVVVEEEEEDGRGREMATVVDCVDNVPHAFCLAHSDVIAAKVAKWIDQAYAK